MVHLPRQPPAGETEDGEHQRHHRENGWDTSDPSFKPCDWRSQHEREQNGERDWHEYGLRPVQDDYDEYTAGERHPSPQCLRRVIHKARPCVGLSRENRRVQGAPASNCVAAESKQACCASDSNPASVKQSAAAEQQHYEDDDDQSSRVHFLSPVSFGERGLHLRVH